MATFQDCLDAVKTGLEAIALTGITASDIRVQKQPWRARQVAPGIFVTPDDESLSAGDGTNLRDDIGYAVRVVMIQKSNRDQTSNLNRLLKWRQDIRRYFINQRLAGVTPVMWCTVEPGPIVLPSAFEGGYDVDGLLIRCLSRETRG